MNAKKTNAKTTRKTTLHRNGTVTYWSVWEQRWLKRVGAIFDNDLATMSPADRERVQRHLATQK